MKKVMKKKNNSNSNNEEIEFNEKCQKIKQWDTRLYNFLNRDDYDNRKTYPLEIIKNHISL